jgi:hypothetical protein
MTMQRLLCTCLDLFAGRPLRWDSFGNSYFADCGRQRYACERCRRAFRLDGQGVWLACGAITAPL